MPRSSGKVHNLHTDGSAHWQRGPGHRGYLPGFIKWFRANLHREDYNWSRQCCIPRSADSMDRPWRPYGIPSALHIPRRRLFIMQKLLTGCLLDEQRTTGNLPKENSMLTMKRCTAGYEQVLKKHQGNTDKLVSHATDDVLNCYSWKCWSTCASD